jgi:hypothetical protein
LIGIIRWLLPTIDVVEEPENLRIFERFKMNASLLVERAKLLFHLPDALDDHFRRHAGEEAAAGGEVRVGKQLFLSTWLELEVVLRSVLADLFLGRLAGWLSTFLPREIVFSLARLFLRLRRCL